MSTNTQKTIIIDDAIPYAKAMFSSLGEVITLPGKEINADSVKHADALVVRSRTQVNQALLEHSRVQFVGSSVVGLDHIDQVYLQKKGIAFYSAQGSNANSVAEFVISALFDLAEYQGFDLTEKTLGIIGVGHVGSLVYQKAQTLGITCLLNDPPRQRNENSVTLSTDFVDIDTCLKADIITLHTPLTTQGADATYDLLSKARLQNIRPDQIIVNAARGGIINEAAWSETATAANIIDCWENEPFISEALYKTAYLATPHIAGHSLDAKVAGGEMVYHALCKAWQAPVQQDWKSQLPPSPSTMDLPLKPTQQSTLHSLFKQTHDIHRDDRAIRADSIGDIHNNYEFYRRNYPIYREWHCHTLQKTKDKTFNRCLKNLGFKLST